MVAVSAAVLDAAAALVAVHPLGAYDAAQLASALAVRDVDPSCQDFVCFDADLREAAARQGGLALVPGVTKPDS